MGILSFDQQEARRLLETSFEPEGDGWVYYRNRSSPGIPVTAEERETYVSSWRLGSSAAFHRKLEGRAPVRPPRGNRAVGRVMRALPVRYGFILFGGSIFVALMGVIAETAIERWFMFAVAALALGVGIAWAVVRRLPDKGGE